MTHPSPARGCPGRAGSRRTGLREPGDTLGKEQHNEDKDRPHHQGPRFEKNMGSSESAP